MCSSMGGCGWTREGKGGMYEQKKLHQGDAYAGCVPQEKNSTASAVVRATEAEPDFGCGGSSGSAMVAGFVDTK